MYGKRMVEEIATHPTPSAAPEHDTWSSEDAPVKRPIAPRPAPDVRLQQPERREAPLEGQHARGLARLPGDRRATGQQGSRAAGQLGRLAAGVHTAADAAAPAPPPPPSSACYHLSPPLLSDRHPSEPLRSKHRRRRGLAAFDPKTLGIEAPASALPPRSPGR